MQIQSINPQNRYNQANPNFKALKYSKKTLDKVALTPKMLKENKKLQKLSQIFDITIVKGDKGNAAAQLVNKFIAEKREDLQKKVLTSLGVGLAIGAVTSILGYAGLFLLPTIALPTLTYLLGNNELKKLKDTPHPEPFVNIRLSKDSDDSFSTSLKSIQDDELSRNTQEIICDKFINSAKWGYFLEVSKRTDDEGNTLAHLCSSKILRYMYNRVAGDDHFFTKVFTTPNKKGERPIHKLPAGYLARISPYSIRLDEKEKKAVFLEKPNGSGRSLADFWFENAYSRNAILALTDAVGPEEACKIRERSIHYYDDFNSISSTQVEKMIDNYFQKDKNGCHYYEHLDTEYFIRLARVLYESKNFDSLHSMMMQKDSTGKRMLHRLLDQDFISIHKDLESFVGKENFEVINDEIVSRKCEETYNTLKKIYEENKELPFITSETRYILSLTPEKYKEVLLWEDKSGRNTISVTCTLKDVVKDYINTFKDNDPEFLKTILKTKIPTDILGSSISIASYFSDSELKKELEDVLGIDEMFNESQEKVLFNRRKKTLNCTFSFYQIKDKDSLNEMLSAFVKKEDKKNLLKFYLNPHQRQPLLDYYMCIDEDMVLETFNAFSNYPEYLYKIITYAPNHILPVHIIFSKKLDKKLIKIIGEEKFAELIPVRKEYGKKIDINYLDELKNSLVSANNKVEKDFRNINFYNPEEVLSFMESSLVRDSDGEILNSTLDGKNEPILFSLADIIPTQENREKLQDIARILESLGKVNYAQKDSLGFNFLEKVLYTENEPLLSAISSKLWRYSPELDICFADIKNENFKKLAQKLQIQFPELNQAVELKSIKTLELLEDQFKSPFYHSDIQGKLICEIAQKQDENFRTALYQRFKDYLPQKTQQELLEEA